VHAHLGLGAADQATGSCPITERYPDFAGLIAGPENDHLSDALRRAETIGRPVGDEDLLNAAKKLTGRTLKPGKRGRKPTGPPQMEARV